VSKKWGLVGGRHRDREKEENGGNLDVREEKKKQGSGNKCSLFPQNLPKK